MALVTLESVGLLAGGVAHDLNNILGPIVAVPELISKDLPDKHPAYSELTMMSKAARRAANVIQDLLSLARQGSYKREPVDLNELDGDCLASPAVALRLHHAPGVACKTNFDASLSPVNGSEPHLTQVILNIAINAIEAMVQSESEGNFTISTTNLTLH